MSGLKDAKIMCIILKMRISLIRQRKNITVYLPFNTLIV